MDETPQITTTENSLPAEQRCCLNTDRELWREREGDYYADSIHVTESGGIGINVGGTVIVNTLRHWFELAKNEILSENPNAFLPHPVPENPTSAPPVSEDSSSTAATSNLNYWHSEYQARLRYMAAALEEAEIWMLYVTSTTDGETYEKANSTRQRIKSALQYKPSPAVEDIGEVEKLWDFILRTETHWCHCNTCQEAFEELPTAKGSTP